MEENKSSVQEVKLSSVCRICHDCKGYIYYGESCIKENISGSRHWHHESCWRKNHEKEY